MELGSREDEGLRDKGGELAATAGKEGEVERLGRDSRELSGRTQASM